MDGTWVHVPFRVLQGGWDVPPCVLPLRTVAHAPGRERLGATYIDVDDRAWATEFVVAAPSSARRWRTARARGAQPMLILATHHWTLSANPADATLLLVRARAPFDTALELEVEVDELLSAAVSFGAFDALIVDLRAGRVDDQPYLRIASKRLLTILTSPCERVAILAGAEAVLERAAKLWTGLSVQPLLTQDPEHAEDHARGMKSTGVRVRRPPRDTPPPDERSTVRPPREAVEGRARDSDLGAEALACNFLIGELAHDVAALIAELDAWAMVREKVIDKLDVRSARTARALARELRDGMIILRATNEKQSSSALYGEMQALCDNARALVRARRTSSPSTARRGRAAEPASNGADGALIEIVRALRASRVHAPRAHRPNARGSPPDRPRETAGARRTRRAQLRRGSSRDPVRRAR
jgi:hypothetical protein